jgi:hypothetical protein NreA
LSIVVAEVLPAAIFCHLVPVFRGVKHFCSILLGGSSCPLDTREAITHQHHPEIVKRLKRADGHLKTIIRMIEDGRSCVQLAQQLQAVESAIMNAKKALIHDHIDHCLDQSLKAPGRTDKAALREFRAVAKYL